MISHFFKSSLCCRILCVVLAFLTLVFTLSPALVQPAEAVAVADDLTLALTLLFTSWAGITFSTNAGAQTAISNLLSSKPAVASSVAGLITKGLVTEGSKLLLTGDVRTAFRDALTDIQDFFQVKSEVVSAAGGGEIMDSFVIGQSYSIPSPPSDDSLRPSYAVYPIVDGSSFKIIRHFATSDMISLYQISGSYPSCEYGWHVVSFVPGYAFFGIFLCSFSDGKNGVEHGLQTVLRDSSGNSSILSVQSSTIGKYNSADIVWLSSPDTVSFKQSQEVDGTQVTEIDWGITFVPDPNDPTEDPNEKVYSAYSIAELLRLLQLNNSDDPGLDPEKMIEELRKLLQEQQTDPDPDPEPDPDPDPDPSDPDTPSGGDGTAPDFNSMMLPGLKDFFPFCIPFDLYKMMQALCAEPEAPKFTFATSFLGQVYTVDIDLSAWDNVAATIRYMVVAIYIVALAVATRKFIKW